VLAGRREPDRDVSGLERLTDGIDQVALHHVKVNRPAQQCGEGSYDRLCVVAARLNRRSVARGPASAWSCGAVAVLPVMMPAAVS